MLDGNNVTYTSYLELVQMQRNYINLRVMEEYKTGFARQLFSECTHVASWSILGLVRKHSAQS